MLILSTGEIYNGLKPSYNGVLSLNRMPHYSLKLEYLGTLDIAFLKTKELSIKTNPYIVIKMTLEIPQLVFLSTGEIYNGLKPSYNGVLSLNRMPHYSLKRAYKGTLDIIDEEVKLNERREQ